MEDGNVITSDKEKADLLNGYFANQTRPPRNNIPLPPLSLITDAKLQDITINPTIVKKVLENLNPNKANEPDGISNRILKECASSLSGPLSIIFNKSLLLGVFPNTWKDGIVSSIFKKGDRQSKVNYRPISLLSCTSKVFERIVFNEMYQYFVSNNLLNACNSGFKKNDSTVNRLLAMLDSIYRGLEERKDVILILLDISKAFDKV